MELQRGRFAMNREKQGEYFGENRLARGPVVKISLPGRSVSP
jgi:hypothetical protein